MRRTITSNGHVRHRAGCDCVACRELRDGTACEQCGGPVLIRESERTYTRVCQHCGASGTTLKSEIE